MSLEQAYDAVIRSALTAPGYGSSQTQIALGGLTADGSATLTNKNLVDNSVLYQDDADPTKKLEFELSGLTTNTKRILTIPDADGTLATTADIPTDYVDLTSAQTVTGTKTLSNLVIDDTLKFNNPADTFQYTLSGGAITADRNIEFGALAQDDTLLYQNQAQSNIGGPKTFINQAFRIQDNTGTRNITFTTSAQTVNVNATFPTLTASDTFVFANESQMVTNKTLDNTNSLQIESLTKTGEQDGDIIVRTAGGWTYLPAGANDDQLRILNGEPTWVSPSYVQAGAFGAGSPATVTGTFTKLLFAPTLSVFGTSDWETTATGGEIKYTGVRTRLFSLSFEMGVLSSVNNNEIQLRIIKNDNVIPSTTHIVGTDANGKQESATLTQLQFASTNDVFSIWAMDVVGSSDISCSGYTWVLSSIN